MAKLMLFVLVALLAATAILGQAQQNSCARHGDPCVSDSQCCKGAKCHRFANRCQVQITPEELQEARRKVLGHRAD